MEYKGNNDNDDINELNKNIFKWSKPKWRNTSSNRNLFVSRIQNKFNK